MYILAIETTGPELSVAVINDKREIVELSSPDKFSHLQNLVPMIEELLKSTGLELSAAAAIATSVGPGSFTGIRIGVSTARALAQALRLKTIAVPTLKSFAYHAEDYQGVICPIFDARRNQVYAGAYLWSVDEMGQRQIIEVVKGGAYDLSDYLGYLRQGLMAFDVSEIMLFGDGVPVYAEKIVEFTENNNINFYDARLLVSSKEISGAIRPVSSIQVASSVAKYALEAYEKEKNIKTADVSMEREDNIFDECTIGECITEKTLLDYWQLEPEYMRKSEAERRLEEGTLGKK